MINDLKKKIIDGRFKHKLLDNLSDYQVNSKDAYKIQEEINNISTTNITQDHKDFLSTMLGYYKREKRVDLWNKYNLKIMALEDKVNNPNAFGVLSLESKEVDEKGKLGSDGTLNDSAILESYEKKTLLRYEESKKNAVTVDVRNGRLHSKELARQKVQRKRKKQEKERLSEQQKRDVQKHVRFPKFQKD